MSLVDGGGGGGEHAVFDDELFDDAWDTGEQADVNTNLDVDFEGSWTWKKARLRPINDILGRGESF